MDYDIQQVQKSVKDPGLRRSTLRSQVCSTENTLVVHDDDSSAGYVIQNVSLLMADEIGLMDTVVARKGTGDLEELSMETGFDGRLIDLLPPLWIADFCILVLKKLC